MAQMSEAVSNLEKALSLSLEGQEALAMPSVPWRSTVKRRRSTTPPSIGTYSVAPRLPLRESAAAHLGIPRYVFLKRVGSL